MTRSEFQNRCDEIATEEANENWDSASVLRRIAGEIGTVALDFDADVSMHADFGEVIENA